MSDGTTVVNAPTAALGAHLELELALNELLGSRVSTLVLAGVTSSQAAPADLHHALEPIAGDRTIRPQVRQLASDLPGSIENVMRHYPVANRNAMTLEQSEDR